MITVDATDEDMLDLLLARRRALATSRPDDEPGPRWWDEEDPDVIALRALDEVFDRACEETSHDPDAGPSREERLVARYGEDVVYG